jgi:outer membrane lipoprotein-sorting protein
MNRFLRTASTSRLLATLGGIVVLIGAGAALALAARGSGPVPKPASLAAAIRGALGAKPVEGISANINFTNNLVDTSEIQGTDPLLTGGQGHVWASKDLLRVELYGDNGDPEIVVNHSSWWVYDPALNTVYEGKLPAHSNGSAKRSSARHEALPTVTQIQTDLNRLAAHLRISGAIPSDVGGQPTYTVKVSPRTEGGLLGQVQLAWDAVKGVPLRFAVYARGASKPVLEVAATNVSYGALPASDFDLKPPAGTHVANIATPATSEASGGTKTAKKHAAIRGVNAVAKQLSFKLTAPQRLDGLQRHSVGLLGTGTHRGAFLLYGRGPGGIVVIEEPATGSGTQKVNLSTGSGDGARGITLPTVTINGASGQELDTALGTVVRFTSGNVTYTVIGSVSSKMADAAARAL